MEIKDYYIHGDNVKKFTKSPNHSGKYASGMPDTIVLHYTAGPAKPAINTLTNPRVKASAHVVVHRDGTITQLIPFNLIAWHAGRSEYKGRTGFNKYSIGIEIENSGSLTKSGNVYRAWFGAAYNPSDVIEAVHRNQTTIKFWHTYTAEQIATVTDLCRLLIDQYKSSYILGHEEIAPGRKSDPGPAFPLDRMRNSLLTGDRDRDEGLELPDSGRISASSLNIRSTPTRDGSKIALPLRKGQKVKVLDKSGRIWYNYVYRMEKGAF